jgi:hypothetical protein
MYSDHMASLSSNLDALRDFVDLIEPILKKKPTMTEDDRTALRYCFYAMKIMEPERFEDIEITENELKKFNKKVKFETKETDKGKSVTFAFPDEEVDIDKLINIFKEIRRSITGSKLLYNSSLISLISSVEWYFSRILHSYFEKYPQVAISGDKIFSYEDLTRFASIEDARKSTIEKKVEEVLRGSFLDWIKYFRGNLKLSMSYIDAAFDELIETFERRNLLTHNNGIVNNIYLSKVTKKEASDFKKGDPINVSRNYLDNRISLFERCCILVGAELWKQIDAKAPQRGNTIIGIAFQHMTRGRWDITEGLSQFVMNDKKLPERDVMIGKINYWLSLKKQNRWNEIKDQAESEDLTAKGYILQLAWYSLCDKKDEFFKLLPLALKAKDIDKESLESFPVFDYVRTDKRFVTVMNKLKKGRKDTIKSDKTPSK